MKILKNKKVTFIALCTVAFLLSFVPLIHVPFKWLEVFFHEISHGMVAILTGGRISSIELHLDGSGLCYHQGGWRLLVSFAGYSGAVLWGLLLYRTATSFRRHSKVIAWGLMLFIVLCTFLWARDLITIVILIFMSGLLFALSRYSFGKQITLLTQFIGIYVMQSALQSPMYLLDGANQGDAGSLASMTFIPAYIWVLVWVVIALVGLRLAWPGKK